jgi:hypothetical protein
MIFGMILGGFGLAIAMVIFHLNQYRVPGDRTPLIERIFLIGSAFFATLTTIAFLSLALRL